MWEYKWLSDYTNGLDSENLVLQILENVATADGLVSTILFEISQREVPDADKLEDAISNFKAKKFYEFGADGWEMFQVLDNGEDTDAVYGRIYFFKRHVV